MRILLINSRPDYQIHPGGDTVQLEKTGAALEKFGLDIDIRGPYDFNQFPKYDLAHIFNIQEPKPAWDAMRELQQRKIPTLISPIYWDLYAYWFENASKEKRMWRLLTRWIGKKIVGRFYERWQEMKAPSNPVWNLQRDILLHADRVLPNSQAEVRLLHRSFNLPDTFQLKADIVPNAIETGLYERLPEPSEWFMTQYGLRDFVMEAGTIYPVKNQLNLIDALFDVEVPLVFVGQKLEAFSAYAARCYERARERGNVVFIDQLPYDQLPGIYALASVHALPSWRETPGLVSLEAAAAGCRIVTTPIGSTRDYFGSSAWYCEPDDLASIRSAVESALSARPSEELRQRILADYSWEEAGKATLASYEKIFQ